MGYVTEVLMYDWNVLVDAMIEGGCNNQHVVEEVLHMYGEKICDKYVLLMIESFGDMCPSILLCHAFETLFDIEECDEMLFDTEHVIIGGMYSDNGGDQYTKLTKLAAQLVND